MKKAGKGQVVNLASEVFFTGSHGFAHYVATKGAVVGLTRALAIELGPDNICINAIAPGFTDTEASRTIADVNKYDYPRHLSEDWERAKISWGWRFFCLPMPPILLQARPSLWMAEEQCTNKQKGGNDYERV